MKFKDLCRLYIIASVAILTLEGCSGNSVPKNEKIMNAFEDRGIIFHSDNCNYYKLNGIIPNCTNYSSGQLYLYLYKNEPEAKKALKVFNSIREKNNMVMPQIFQVKNILLMFLTHENRTDPYTNREKQLLEITSLLEKGDEK